MDSIFSDPPLRGSTEPDIAGPVGSVTPVGGKPTDNKLLTTVGY